MNKKFFLMCLITTLFSLTLLPGSTWASMAFARIIVDGEDISQGTGTKQGFEDFTYLAGFEHFVSIPTDPDSGSQTGARVHGPVTLIKYTDASTPKLYKALTEGRRLTLVEILFYRVDAEGRIDPGAPYYKVTLENALIIGIEAVAGVSIDSADREKVSINYQRITWNFTTGNIEHRDDWGVPR